MNIWGGITQLGKGAQTPEERRDSYSSFSFGEGLSQLLRMDEAPQ